MAFIESPRFTKALAYGYEGGPGFSTEVVALPSGHEKRNQNWARDRGRWTVTRPLEDADALAELIAYFRLAHGRAHGFRFFDHADYSATQAQGRLGTSATGTGGAAYQMHKRYNLGGAEEQLRKIIKPVAGTIQVWRGGVLQTAGSHYTLDATTGIVTFGTVVSSAESLAWAGEFDVPVRFDTDQLLTRAVDAGVWFADGLPIVELRA